MDEQSCYFLPCFVGSGRYLTQADLNGLGEEPIFFYENHMARLACHLVGVLYDRAMLDIPEMAILKFGDMGTISKPEIYEGGPIVLLRESLDLGDEGDLMDANVKAVEIEANPLSIGPADLRVQADMTPQEIRMLLKMYFPTRRGAW